MEQKTLMLDAAGVARELGCSARTIFRLRDAGRLPQPVRVGGMTRWPRHEIEAWIVEGCPRVGREGVRR